MFKNIVLVLKKKRRIFLNNPVLITVLGRLGGVGLKLKAVYTLVFFWLYRMLNESPNEGLPGIFLGIV